MNGDPSASMPEPRGCRFTLRTMLLAVLALSLPLAIAAPFFHFATAWQKHNSLSKHVREKIQSLKLKRPSDVPADQWDRAVDWTDNLICQVYFAPDKGDPGSLQRLCKSLDSRINGQVSLTTLQGTWEECEKAPRSGSEYAIRFRDVRLLTKEPITDDDLPHLWSPDKCLYLELNNTQVTDQGLKHLESMSNLTYLNLQNTQVTDEGVARLRTALPGREIVR